jgi:hypothetical protein
VVPSLWLRLNPGRSATDAVLGRPGFGKNRDYESGSGSPSTSTPAPQWSQTNAITFANSVNSVTAPHSGHAALSAVASRDQERQLCVYSARV